MARVNLEPAFVLHRRPYRETSLLVEAFTASHGRIGLVARGARRPRHRWRAGLSPFVPVAVSWSGRGELGTVTGAEVLGTAARPLGAALISGFYLNELILRLVQRNDPHPGLFDDYAEALYSIAASAEIEPPLRFFEKRLLQAIGYGLELQREADGGAPIVADSAYRYICGRGALPDDRQCGREGVAVHGETLLSLCRERFDDAGALREAKRLLRVALGEQLGGRPLRSRELLSGLSRLGDGPLNLSSGA